METPRVTEIIAELAKPPKKFNLDYLMSLPSLKDNVFVLQPKEEVPDDAA